MNLSNLLGDIFPVPSGDYKYLSEIVTFLNQSIMPISIVLLVAAGLFSVVLAFMIMKAESSERSNEMKKRLGHLIIAVICIIGCVWLLAFVLSQMDTIIGFFKK